jgi:uncharacterized protein YegJ (DUF2314 family)
MIRMVPVLLWIFLLFSCQGQNSSSVSQEAVRTMQVEQIDEEILQIAEDARNTLPSFFRHLNRPGAGEEQFCVKYPFAADNDGGIEQVWLTSIYFKNGYYYGVLASSPILISGIKKGDKVTFEADNITDWMYMRNDRIIGGYSIKYLLEKIPDNQRSDREFKLLQMFH